MVFGSDRLLLMVFGSDRLSVPEGDDVKISPQGISRLATIYVYSSEEKECKGK